MAEDIESMDCEILKFVLGETVLAVAADELAILLEVADEAPFMAACKMGVDVCSRFRLVDEGDEEDDEDDDDEDDDEEDEATLLLLLLLLALLDEETVTTFCGEPPWKTVVMMSWLPA